MHIDLNIHHRCASLAEFKAISERIAALLSEFSAAPAAHVTADQVLRTDVTASAVPPAPPVMRSEPAASVAAGAVESSVPAAFAGALDEPAKRKRRTKAEMEAARAADAANAVAAALPAPAPVQAPTPVVDIFAAAPVAAPAAPVVATAPPAAKPALHPQDGAGAAVTRQHIKNMMIRLFDEDDGEIKVQAIFANYGGSLAKVPDDKLMACLGDFNAALHPGA